MIANLLIKGTSSFVRSSTLDICAEQLCFDMETATGLPMSGQEYPRGM